MARQGRVRLGEARIIRQVKFMNALFGTLGIICAYAIAGWMGYTLGFDAGVRSEKTKRGVRRG